MAAGRGGAAARHAVPMARDQRTPAHRIAGHSGRADRLRGGRARGAAGMMTAEDRFRVRPRFAKWSVLAFALLLPILAFTIWDYVEMHRFRSRIDAIAARGEPMTIQGPFR